MRYEVHWNLIVNTSLSFLLIAETIHPEKRKQLKTERISPRSQFHVTLFLGMQSWWQEFKTTGHIRVIVSSREL